MSENIVISTFYKFINISDCTTLQKKLLKFCKEEGLKGTILIATEGINSTIAGTRTSINNLYETLANKYGIKLDNIKESFADFKPFLKTKVKIKDEIVALKVNNIDSTNCGEYIDPEEWDEFISQDDVILIDTRNNYEVKIGAFKGAINPKTTTFRDFPDWVAKNKEKLENKKIAMYCTGGIRCEKSTAYMKSMGYNKVYHLKGGILKYFEDTKNSSGMWKGDCFVFDDRVALTSDLSISKNLICSSCNNYISTDDLRDNANKNNLICMSCVKEWKENNIQ